MSWRLGEALGSPQVLWSAVQQVPQPRETLSVIVALGAQPQHSLQSLTRVPAWSEYFLGSFDLSLVCNSRGIVL